MKIFLTINLVCITAIVVAVINDHMNWEGVYTSNGGWTTHYTISRKVRAFTKKVTNIAGGILLATWFIGCLIFIWTL